MSANFTIMKVFFLFCIIWSCLTQLVGVKKTSLPGWPDWAIFQDDGYKFSWVFFGYFEKQNSLSKESFAYFLGNFWKTQATFDANIWSHCSLPQLKLNWSHWHENVYFKASENSVKIRISNWNFLENKIPIVLILRRRRRCSTVLAANKIRHISSLFNKKLFISIVVPK